MVAWWAMGGMSMALLEQARRRGLAGRDRDRRVAPLRPAVRRLAARVRAPALGARRGRDARADPGCGSTARGWLFASAYLRERAVAAGLALGEAGVVHAGVDPASFRRAQERHWGGACSTAGGWTRARASRPRSRPSLRCPDARCGRRRRRRRAPRAARALRPSAGRGARALRAAAARRARRRVRRPRRAALPRPVGGAVGARAARGDGRRPAGGRDRERRLGGVPRDGENCLLVQPGEADAVAAAVQRLAGDRELRHRLRAGGLETAAAHDLSGFAKAVAAELDRVAR